MRLTPFGAAALCLALGGHAAFAQTSSGQTGSSQTGSEQPATAPAAAEAAAEYGIDTMLADVNGEKLTVGDLVTIRRQLPDQYQQLPDEVLFSGLRDQMVDQMLLAQAAAAAGMEQQPAIALHILNQRRATLAESYLRQEIAARVTPEAVEALYNERYVDAPPEQEVHAAHILVETEETAKALKAELDGGADFAELAKANGTDGTAARGGDLGWFVRADMVPEFADAAFAMEPGTVSDPVKTAFGWHLIRLEEKRERAAPALDDVRGQLAGDLAQKAQEEIVAAVRENAKIAMPETMPPPSSIRADALLDEAK